MVVYCAVCHDRFETDRDHVQVVAETVRTHDRNEDDMFVFHTDCWSAVSGGWMEPA